MLKGKATIELTNVKTGEVERYEEENLVTNAVQDLYSVNPRFFHFFPGYDDFERTELIPTIPNVIGGILLFNNEIPENTNEYYANDTNTIIGYSNNNVNTNKDPLRGSTNVIDTKELDNGYKFVFDFATSQGNGLISSIALTSTWGGEGYCGSTYNHNAMKSVRNAYELTYGTSVTVAPSETENFFIHMVYWNPISDCFISVDCINKNTIRL